MHMRDTAAPLQKAEDKGNCLKLSFCVCTGQGALAWRLHAKFVSWLKPCTVVRSVATQAEGAAPKAKAKKVKPHARLMVEDARLVVRLQFLQLATGDDTQSLRKRRAQLADPENYMLAESCVDDDLWLHIGYMNFKTFMCCNQIMVPADRVMCGDKEIWTLACHAPFKCARSLELFSKFVDFNCVCSASVYQIRCPAIALTRAEMAPDRVTVELFPEIPKQILWLGTDAEDAEQLITAAKRKRSDRARSAHGRGGRRQAAAKNRARGRGRLQRPRPGRGRVLTDSQVDPGAPALENVEEEAILAEMSSEDSDAAEALYLEMLMPEDALEIQGSDEEELEGNHLPEDRGVFPMRVPPEQPEAASSSHQPAAKPRPEAEVPAAVPEAGAPAAPVPPENAAERKARTKADAVLDFPNGGSIHYYGKTKAMVAFCPKCENDCRRSRTVNASQGRPNQGRPLGLLLAWLDDAKNTTSRAEHQTLCVPSHAQRQKARDDFRHLPGYDALARVERARREGEAEDPS